MQDATRQGKIVSFFLMKRKESCARKRGEGRKRGGGEGKKCLTFFKGIINSLSALVICDIQQCKADVSNSNWGDLAKLE